MRKKQVGVRLSLELISKIEEQAANRETSKSYIVEESMRIMYDLPNVEIVDFDEEEASEKEPKKDEKPEVSA